jgi:hypothetical protein
MKALLRTLLLWFLLAAVPFGGFASATMLRCGPASVPAAAPDGRHAMHGEARQDHAAAMLGARHGEAPHDHAAMLAAQHGGDAGHHAGHAKCASTGACCIGAPLAPALPAAPPLQDGRCATVPFVPAEPAAVDLAGLERPPKHPFA